MSEKPARRLQFGVKTLLALPVLCAGIFLLLACLDRAGWTRNYRSFRWIVHDFYINTDEPDDLVGRAITGIFVEEWALFSPPPPRRWVVFQIPRISAREELKRHFIGDPWRLPEGKDLWSGIRSRFDEKGDLSLEGGAFRCPDGSDCFCLRWNEKWGDPDRVIPRALREGRLPWTRESFLEWVDE